jgi:hypothetical protein
MEGITRSRGVPIAVSAIVGAARSTASNDLNEAAVALGAIRLPAELDDRFLV